MTEQSAAAPASPSPPPLRPWEALALNAVGHVIEFWNFKRNHGRIWGLLFLRDQPMSATELQDTLELSKGAVSMLTRELEQWRVLRRVRSPSDAVWRFTARTDLMDMITRVLARRERELVTRVVDELAEAEGLARDDPHTPPDTLERLRRMRALADLVAAALSTLIKTATLDVRGVFGLLTGRGGRSSSSSSNAGDTDHERDDRDLPGTGDDDADIDDDA